MIERRKFKASELAPSAEPGWVRCPWCFVDLWQTEDLGRCPTCETCGCYMIPVHGKAPPA